MLELFGILRAMPKLVSDGEKRYAEANSSELQDRYEQRVTEIKDRYTASAQPGVLRRWVQYLAVRREIARAKREVFGEDNLYFNPG